MLAVVVLPGVSAKTTPLAVGVESHAGECLGLPVLCVENEDSVFNPAMKDIYRVIAVPGTDFEVRVDTVAFATAFDPWARICTGWSGTTLTGCFASGDDNFACSFPPPSYSCPRIAGTLPAGPNAIFYIGVASHPCCNGSFRTPGLGEYNVEFVGVGGLLELVADNAPGNLP